MNDIILSFKDHTGALLCIKIGSFFSIVNRDQSVAIKVILIDYFESKL